MRAPDQEVRDRIVGARGISLAVEAGAGTGKTTLLVDRYVSLLEGGVPVSRLAVITFTKKAAAELGSRIRRRLARRRAEGRAWAAAALEDFDLARVGTTDSFCLAILSEFPFEANVPPGFTVADEVVQDALREIAWSRFLESGAPACRDRLTRLREAGAAPATLRELAEALVANRDLPPALPDPVPVPDLIEEFGRALEEARAHEHLCRDPEDALLCRMRELATEWDMARSLGGVAGERALLGRRRAGRRYASRRLGRAASWGGKENKVRAVDALQVLETVVDRFLEARGLALARDAAAWAGGFAREYENVKRERGILDFRDLALATRALLRDHPATRRRIASRFEEILMDEVQDTDPLQMEIAFLLAARGSPPADPLEAELHPGRLFLVGDPKQSIYRFRRADIEQYDRARERVASSGAAPSLRVNFRSHPAILRFVNRTFRDWMQPAEGTSFQARFEDLEPGAAPPEDGRPRVTLALPDPALAARLRERAHRPELPAEERRELEIDAVVRVLRHFLGADGAGDPWIVRDPESGDEREARPSDVAVLVRKIDWGDRLLDALRRAGLPATASGGRRFYAREEIETLLAVLEAVLDPDDDLARFAALRSLAFGVPDDALVLHFLGEGDVPAATEADRALRALAVEARRLPVPELLEHLTEELRLLPAFGFRPDGAGRVESLRMLVESSDSLVEAGIDSLPETVRWLRARSGGARAEGPGETDPGEAGGVRILTMHKAKGLEFPVVVLADLAGRPRRGRRIVVDRARGRIEFRLSRASGVQTPGFPEASAREDRRRRAEDVRLLYVAMTRARDHLVVSWPEGEGGFLEGGDLAARIGCSPGEPPPPEAELGVIRTAELPVVGDDGQLFTIDPDRLPVPAAPAQDPYPAARAAARGRRVLAATRLVGAPPPAAGPGPGGKAFGTLLHKVLERWDPGADQPVEEIVRDAGALVARELGEAAPDGTLLHQVVEAARRVTRDPSVRAIWETGRVLREVPFLLPGPDGFLSGVLDVLIEAPDGALSIVDYKTDRIGPGGLEAACRHYRPQALAYALAVARITSREVNEVSLLFLARDPVEVGSFRVDQGFLAEAEALTSTAGETERGEWASSHPLRDPGIS